MKIRLTSISDSEPDEIIKMRTAKDIFKLAKKLQEPLIIQWYLEETDRDQDIAGVIEIYDSWNE